MRTTVIAIVSFIVGAALSALGVWLHSEVANTAHCLRCQLDQG